MDYARVVLICLVVAFTAIAAVSDFRTRRLPNALTVTGFVLAILYHSVVGWLDGGFGGLAWRLGFSAAGFATGFGILLVLWLIRGGGAGDVKLMGALGAWLGAWMTLKVFLAATVLVVISGFIAIIGAFFKIGFEGILNRLKIQSAQGQDESNKKTTTTEEKRLGRATPFGVPVAIATWIILIVDQIILTSTGR